MQQQEEEERKNREDELFEQELRKLTMEALEKGKNAARTMAPETPRNLLLKSASFISMSRVTGGASLSSSSSSS